MSKRLFDFDPDSGLTEWYEDLPDGGVAIHYEQDCEPVIELNKARQSMGRSHYAADPDLWKVASIPITVQYKWLIEEGIDVMNREHWPKIKAKLNSNEYRYLKTAEVII